MKHVVIGAHLERDDVEPLAVALPAGPLFLSALAVPDDQPMGDRELLLNVAAVRARLLERATFIAVRYGFAAASAEEAHGRIATHVKKWRALLEEHRDDVEMTLKVAASSPGRRPRREDFTSGGNYLRALHAATSAVAIDPKFREAVETTLVPLARRRRWTTRDEKSLELSLLVPRSRVRDVLNAGESLRGTSTAFLLSGPWPLEAFADDDHQ
jgi:hypothetical protein